MFWGEIKRRLRENITNIRIAMLNRKVAAATPCFSVVIPIYDRTSELKIAIESILSQTFRNYELLLICDGSPDETVAVVKSYLHSPKVKAFFYGDNSGNPCRGRNKGIEMARGHYVVFLDSDDIATPNRLERSLYHFLLKKVDVVGGAIKYLTDDKSCRGFTNGQLGFTGEECSYQMLLEGNRLSICTVAVKRHCLIQFGGFREEMRYREDHELWLRLAYHGCSFYNSPEVFAKYRIHESNAELSYLADDQKWFAQALALHSRSY